MKGKYSDGSSWFMESRTQIYTGILPVFTSRIPVFTTKEKRYIFMIEYISGNGPEEECESSETAGRAQ